MLLLLPPTPLLMLLLLLFGLGQLSHPQTEREREREKGGKKPSSQWNTHARGKKSERDERRGRQEKSEAHNGCQCHYFSPLLPSSLSLSLPLLLTLI